MSDNKAYAKESLPTYYQHRFHAGNVGDVWKHAALLAALRSLLQDPSPLTLVDAFAGEGTYSLGPTGEWTEGIGALVRQIPSPAVSSALHQFLAFCRPPLEESKCYRGSPPLLASFLRPQDALYCFETDPEAVASLTRALAGTTAHVRQEDGMKGLLKLATETSTRLFALVDPPWNKKEDWKSIPSAIAESLKAAPQISLALWYPIKSYTRVTTMLAYFKSQGISATALDLITTPLTLQRNRLNGSGMLLINVSPSVLSACAEMAPTIGAACATHQGFWEFKASVIA
jgi:23S rRNA (adenine2030-N6)-methyltransferase